jgi:hypothetical protein
MKSGFRLLGRSIAPLGFLICLLSATCSTLDAEVLDQHSDGPDVTMSAIADSVTGFSQEIGETFTVGISGTLSRIEVLLIRAGSFDDAVLSVYDTTNDLPNMSLGSVHLAPAQIPGSAAFVSFDVGSLQIPIHANDVLAFGVTSAGSGLYLMPNSFQSNPYVAGTGVRRTLSAPPGPWSAQAYDYGFRTYVNAQTVLFGDYNGNGIVDAADYTVWRDTVAAGGSTLSNDPTPGTVDQSDYAYWSSHFGSNGGGAGSRAATLAPEPTSLTFGLLCLVHAVWLSRPLLRARRHRIVRC